MACLSTTKQSSLRGAGEGTRRQGGPSNLYSREKSAPRMRWKACLAVGTARANCGRAQEPGSRSCPPRVPRAANQPQSLIPRSQRTRGKSPSPYGQGVVRGSPVTRGVEAAQSGGAM